MYDDIWMCQNFSEHDIFHCFLKNTNEGEKNKNIHLPR